MCTDVNAFLMKYPLPRIKSFGLPMAILSRPRIVNESWTNSPNDREPVSMGKWYRSNTRVGVGGLGAYPSPHTAWTNFPNDRRPTTGDEWYRSNTHVGIGGIGIYPSPHTAMRSAPRVQQM